MKIYPAQNWRAQKRVTKLIGKKFVVVVATQVFVTSPEFEASLPYSLAIVEDEQKNRYELISETGLVLKKGDQVEGVLRRISEVNQTSLINYGVKLVKDT